MDNQTKTARSDLIREQARSIHRGVRLIRNKVIHRIALRKEDDGFELPELTPRQMNSLMAIHENEPLTVKHLAELGGVSAPSASAMVERLVEMGLVVREQSKRDRREVDVRLSEYGQRNVGRMEDVLLDAIEEVLEKLGPETARTWADCYCKVETVLKEKTAPGGAKG